MTRARDLANIADGTFTATDLDLSGTLTVSGDANFDSGTLFVDVSANAVGIGTTTINEKLVLGSADSGSNFLQITNSTTTAADNRGFYVGIDANEAGRIINRENTDIVFSTNNTEVMWLRSNGNLGIGTSGAERVLHAVSGQQVVAVFESLSSTAGRIGVMDTGTTGSDYVGIGADGDNLKLYAGGANPVTVDSTGNVGIGTSSPATRLELSGVKDTSELRLSSTTNDSSWVVGEYFGKLSFYSADSSGAGAGVKGSIVTAQSGSSGATPYMTFNVASTSANDVERMRIDSSGNVGVGTSTIRQRIHQHVSDSGANYHAFTNLTTGTGASDGLVVGISADEDALIWNHENKNILFGTNNTERMRIDSSGNLFVGTTDTTIYSNTSGGETGFAVSGDGSAQIARETTTATQGLFSFNKMGVDGNILEFYKDGAGVGSVSTIGSAVYLGTGNTQLLFRDASNDIRPVVSGGTNRDDVTDLGASSARFDNIYATNGTIQTSDANEKQDITELDEAERRVAVACKGLLRKFRWKSAIEEKGDDARIHFGIIAQDLQAAFEAEGLDAGRYAMFINSTWTDEETGEERSRMGVRYSELLAFIIAAL